MNMRGVMAKHRAKSLIHPAYDVLKLMINASKQTNYMNKFLDTSEIIRSLMTNDLKTR